jgi:hypothetical protein
MGHIALNAGIGQELKKYLYRRKFGIRSIIESLQKSKASGKSSSIVVIEGDKIGKKRIPAKVMLKLIYQNMMFEFLF